MPLTMGQNQPVPPAFRYEQEERGFSRHIPTFIPEPPCPMEATFDDNKYHSRYFWRAEQKKQEARINAMNIDLLKPLTPEQSEALARLAYINNQKNNSSVHETSDCAPPPSHQRNDECLLI